MSLISAHLHASGWWISVWRGASGRYVGLATRHRPAEDCGPLETAGEVHFEFGATPDQAAAAALRCVLA